jgi:Holliday junction resolvasome RuvABC DNA-binding subunit
MGLKKSCFLSLTVSRSIELIDRLGRKTALKILYRYGSAKEILRVLSDEKRTEKEFREIEGIGKIMGQRIIDERKGLIANLQTKIILSGTYTFS